LKHHPALAAVLVLVWMVVGCSQKPAGTVTGTPRANVTPSGISSEGSPIESDRPTAGAMPEESPVATAGLLPTTQIQLPLAANEGPGGTPESTLPAEPYPIATDPAPPPTATPNYPRYDGPPLDRDEIGVQIHLHREDLDKILDHLKALNVGWVKVQVSWKLYEPQPGSYDDFRFGELDQLVSAAAGQDIKVLLSVAKAPEWSRTTTELDGPPLDPAHYQAFMNVLATRYQGRVAAYELWNEPNLNREWNGSDLGGAAFVNLIRQGAAGVRAAAPEALLISGAPATTGINDGLTAIDDRQFLQQMVTAGVADVVDVIGAHPYGWANPPDSTAYAQNPAESGTVAPTHNNHPSFFFADTLRDYRAILDQSGRQEMPIWSTEFGWGSYDGFGQLPPEGVEYMAYVDEQQQARYILRAYELAHDWPWAGPLFLWNLNFAPTFGPDFVESAYSLLRPDGSLRPVYRALPTLVDGD
jgi:hypothetical protein